MLDAIDHYDRERKVSFEAYARFRIRRAVQNALTEQARLIRLPKQVVERRRTIARAEAMLSAATGGPPTAEQLAAARALGRGRREARRGTPPVSLDELVLPAAPPATVLADPEAADPELAAIEHERATLLQAAIADLPERQRRIVGRRWGVDPAAGAATAELTLSTRRRQTIGRDALYRLRGTLRTARIGS